MSETFQLRPAQSEYLRLHYQRLQELQERHRRQYQQQASQFNEALTFIKKDLGVPFEENYVLTGDFKMFALPEPPKPTVVVDNSKVGLPQSQQVPPGPTAPKSQPRPQPVS